MKLNLSNVKRETLDIGAFRTELAALLAKYNAVLGVDISGDTHGISTNFSVELDHKDHLLNRFSSYLSASDLRIK